MILFRKAILVIHGFAGGTYDEEKLANYLERSSRFDVYTFTLPGHEKRTFKTVKYMDWIKAAESQVETLIEYGYKNIYLIGHSMGGVIACHLANKYKQVKKVVLAAPAFNYLTVKENSNNLEKIKRGIGVIKSNSTDEVLTRFLKLPITSLKEFTKLINEYKDSYSKIQVPTLILHGDKDTLVPLESSQKIYSELPSRIKYIIILKNVTHDIFREVTTEIFEKVKEFLE